MAKLTMSMRDGFSKSTFGLPGSRKYPINDKSHAVAAKSRAKQQLNKGNLSSSSYKQIVSKANSKLRGG
jgi:hypothetical protein